MTQTIGTLVVVPVIETEHLILRGHVQGDFEDCFSMWSDPVVTRHIGGKPSSQEDVWNRILRYVGHWSLMGYGYWLIGERATGRFVGEVGLANGRREIEPAIDAPEIGWALAPWAQGRGWATEAARATVNWGVRNLGSKRTVCMIEPANVASIRVAEKCGYRELSRTTYKGEPTILFERSA